MPGNVATPTILTPPIPLPVEETTHPDYYVGSSHIGDVPIFLPQETNTHAFSESLCFGGANFTIHQPLDYLRDIRGRATRGRTYKAAERCLDSGR